MKRREFVVLAGGAIAWPLLVHAQTPALIGWLGGSSKEAAAVNLNAFLQGLRDLGHEEGVGIHVEYRWAEGDLTRLAALAKELVAISPRLIVTATHPASIALGKVTSSTPIIGALVVDPLKTGLAESYNHPAHNFTGVLMTLDSLPTKQAELLLRVIPHAVTIGVLVNPASASSPVLVQNLEAALKERRITLIPVEARSAADLDQAFETLKHQPIAGLVVLQDTVFFTQAQRIIKFVEAARLPAIHGFPQHAEQGGLMSYGVDIPQNFYRAAYFVDRVLKGDQAGDLPIELPTKLELVINLKAAQKLGIEIPPTLLAIADKVIE